MASNVKAIPEAFHTVTAQLVVRDGDRAIDFCKRAFGAEEIFRMVGPDGKTIAHAELKIGDSIIFLSDEFPGSGVSAPETLKGTTMGIHLYVQDVDAAFKRAVSAGAKVRMPVADMFWGDRFGKLTDPFGHEWGLATHTRDLTPEQVEEGAKAFYAQMGKKQS